MTKFTIIRPAARTIKTLDFDDYRAAMKAAGLNLIDFGTVAKWPPTAPDFPNSTLNIIVYELGLLQGAPTEYFALNGQLFNGNAILFRADQDGETIDMPIGLAEHFAADECKHFLWFDSPDAVEAAIAAGEVNRPQTTINGKVIWQWTGKPETQH